MVIRVKRSGKWIKGHELSRLLTKLGDVTSSILIFGNAYLRMRDRKAAYHAIRIMRENGFLGHEIWARSTNRGPSSHVPRLLGPAIVS